jgi:hypothetical protein
MVGVCTNCPSTLPNTPIAGNWLPAWTNAVTWRRATTYAHRQMRTNRDFAGALRQGLIRLWTLTGWN